ncbi:MAG: hypothetical protein COA94_07885 [Rickettsiales bacterium]|nr:MAG: hypothetical protein COA94_07885 [Rickettsiales bacterium]
MKAIKLKSFVLIIFLTTSLFALDSAFASKRRTLVIAGDYWCPYNCHPDSKMPGYLVELATRALHIYKIDIEYRMMPWTKALKEVKKGNIDAVIGLTDFEGNGLQTTRVALEYTQSSAFTRTDSKWVYDGVRSLTRKKLGIIIGYAQSEEINNYIGMNYITKPDLFVMEGGKNAVIDSIANLIDGDIDVCIGDRRVFNHYIKENGLEPYIREAGKIDKIKHPLYIAFSPKTLHIDQYIKCLEEGLAALKATGEDDYLRQKYKISRKEHDL